MNGLGKGGEGQADKGVEEEGQNWMELKGKIEKDEAEDGVEGFYFLFFYLLNKSRIISWPIFGHIFCSH